MHHVPNDELDLESIPAADSEWSAHGDFALSYFGYETLGASLSSLANAASPRYREEGALPSSLTALRACLFFEHRRAVHLGAPSDSMRAYARALLNAIRDCVEKGALD